MSEYRTRDPQGLRAQAVRLLQRTGGSDEFDEVEDFRQLVYELQLYQAELQIQNGELRRVQLKLEDSRNHFQDLYDFAPVGYVTVDSSGQIESANLVAADFFGTTREVLLGSWLSQYVKPDCSDKLFLHYGKTLSAVTRQSCELQLNASGTEQRYARFDSVALSNRSGKIASSTRGGSPALLRIAITDVTKEKAEVRRRIKLEEEARNDDRLRTLGTIASGVAHDFNNLLCPVMSFVELATIEISADSAAQELLGKALQAVSAASELCKKMLGYVGAEQKNARPLDVQGTIKNNLPLLKSHLESSIQLTAPCETPLPSIVADATQVERVIQNLVVNAVDAIGDKSGHIQVSAWEVFLNQRAIAAMSLGSDATPGKFVCIEVVDDGCGMDAETQSKVFDPFFTTKFSGRGLGTASVVGIARSHHAAILIDSQPGSGTSIGVYFPVSDQPPEQPAVGREQGIIKGRATILIVDDDSMVCDATKALLEQAGYEVKVALSGQLAVDLNQDGHPDIDLVLLDMAMPGLNGVETLKQLRIIKPDVVVCMRSGFTQRSALDELGAMNVAAVIAKPCSGRELTQKLDDVLSTEGAS